MPVRYTYSLDCLKNERMSAFTFQKCKDHTVRVTGVLVFSLMVQSCSHVYNYIGILDAAVLCGGVFTESTERCCDESSTFYKSIKEGSPK